MACHIIKIGGNTLRQLSRATLRQIHDSYASGDTVILVHGAGPMVDAALADANLPITKKNGLRVTDHATLAVMTAVLRDQVYPLVQHLMNQLHLPTQRLEEVITAKPNANQDYGYVGSFDHCDAVLDNRVVYLAGPLLAAANGQLLNVNADDVAYGLAVQYRADALHFVTDVPGVLDAHQQVIPVITPSNISALIADGQVVDGMRVKVESALAACAKGVQHITLGQSLVPADGTVIQQEEISDD